MSWFGLGKEVESAGNGVSTVIESVRFALTGDLPPEERIKMQELLIRLEELNMKIREGQLRLNEIDAQSKSLFKSGWRPLLGWIAVTGFSLVFVLFPIAEWVLNIVVVFNKIVLTKEELMALKPPVIDGWLLLNLLGALLGIGTLRTIEKSKGITK